MSFGDGDWEVGAEVENGDVVERGDDDGENGDDDDVVVDENVGCDDNEPTPSLPPPPFAPTLSSALNNDVAINFILANPFLELFWSPVKPLSPPPSPPPPIANACSPAPIRYADSYSGKMELLGLKWIQRVKTLDV